VILKVKKYRGRGSIYSKGTFKDLSLCDLLEINEKLWKGSMREYNERYSDRYIKDKIMYRKIHCKIVADLGKDMFNSNFSCLNLKENRIYLENVLYLGCLTHDIRKFDKKHGAYGANWMLSKLTDDEYCKKNNIPILSIDVCNDICILIKFHKSNNLQKSIIDEAISNNYIVDENIKSLLFFIRLSDKLSHFIVESKFKVITEKDVLKKTNEFLIKMNDSLLEEDLLNKVLDNILKDFKDMYCNRQILCF